ncbi:MAG: AAA family ATPase, partial [Gemmatimonas sp.]
LADLEERLEGLRAGIPDADARIALAEAERESAHRARATVDASRLELARLAGEQRERTQRLERELAVAEERQRSTTMRRERAEQEQRENEAFGRRLAEDRERAAADRTTLASELAEAGEALQQRVAVEGSARDGVQRARVALETLERQVREHRDQARRIELDREGAAREQAETRQRREQLELERQRLADVFTTTERELSAAADGLSMAQASAATALAELEGARLAAAIARTVDSEARAELASAVEQRTALEGRMNALEALERERVGLAPSAAKLLKERDRFGEGAVLGPLTDFVTADGDAARLVERYLGATMHAIVVRDADAAAAVRRWHADTQPGPLLLLPLDVVAHASVDMEPARDSLGSSVQATGGVVGWVRALLGKVRAVDSGEAFVDERGAVFLPGTASGPGPLQRRAEITRLRADVAAAESARENAAMAAEGARLALGEAERVQQAATEASNRAQGESRRADEVRTEVTRRRERAERELAQSSALAERLLSRMEELETRVQDLAARSATLESRAGEADAAIAEARSVLTVAEAELEQAREQRAAWQVSQAQAQARLSVAIDREKRLLEEDSTAAARLESLANELSSLSEADQQLAQQLSAWRAELDTQQKTLSDADARLADAERGVAAATIALDGAERALDDARRSAAALGEQVHGAQLRHTELSGRREAIRQRLETEWRRTLEDLLGGFESLEDETDALRTEAQGLRGALDELGPVNPLAIEEHQEEQRRLEFLTGQRNDLVSAKQSLHQAIREIDSTARELFLATFTQVRDNFKRIFQTLFDGGECDLRLENPDTPLDCDIEIHASPRGKKTQRIHLLSSGERALVALSLLFGIFLTKPSPFCLLDEVDAPLDDQNIGRFVRMLNQFKSRTQFIVITHNPRTTTEAADAVYGVTMQEPGVSSIVSVRLRGGHMLDDDNALPRETPEALADVLSPPASNDAASESPARGVRAYDGESPEAVTSPA